MKKLNKLGFTLIELLVVITIIGILATGATSVYTSQIQKARDSTRITDLEALRGGIEQYYQDTSVYPKGGSGWLSTTSEVDVQDFLPTLAEDPKHDQTCNGSRCGYIYTVGPDKVGITAGAYEVSTAFESDGNKNSKAINTKDNGSDDARLEVGTLKTTSAGTDLDTTADQATTLGTTAATADEVTIIIKRNNIYKKS